MAACWGGHSHFQIPVALLLQLLPSPDNALLKSAQLLLLLLLQLRVSVSDLHLSLFPKFLQFPSLQVVRLHLNFVRLAVVLLLCQAGLDGAQVQQLFAELGLVLSRRVEGLQDVPSVNRVSLL